jgi:D-alanyl-D-alanine carboxypeptidase (penicillin-binding protein 5/6)
MIKSTGSLRLLVVASFLAASAPAFAKKHVAQPGSPNDDTTTTAAPSGPPPTPDSPTGDKNTPEPPVLADMTAYVLMDAKTGAVLAEAAPNMQLAPASLTKLMTAHIVFQALHDGSLKLDQNVTITPEAWHAGGSRMFLSPNTQVTVDQLLHGLIIDSGNDAAVALAEQVAGTQDAFVQIMNKDAATLGLTNTNYTNVDGLPDPALHTSAMDVALLSRAILQDEPEILNISKMQSYTYDNITQQSWNPVLFRDPTVDGLKTGLTDESGHCIDVTGVRNGMRLIAVVTGGPSWHASTAAIESLLDYGQKFFTDAQIATVGAPIGTVSSQALDAGSVTVGTPKDITLTLPTDATKAIQHNITYTADLTPGVTKGEVLGTVTFTANGKTLATSPVIALTDAPAATFATKLKRKLSQYL